MSSEKTNPDDLRDRLIDGGLREVVGGETPPDLSEQILFAATGEHAEKLPTRSRGDEAMTAEHNEAVKRRSIWIGLTLAASLLVAAGLLWPTLFSEQNVAKKENKSLGDDGRVHLNAFGTGDIPAEESEPAEIQLPDFELAPIDRIVEVEDGGTVLSSGVKRIDEARKDSARLGEQEKKPDALVLGVTPRIIVDQVEEENLGVADGESREGLVRSESIAEFERRVEQKLGSRDLSLSNNSVNSQDGPQELINDAHAGKQAGASDASGLDRSKGRQVSPNMTFGDAAVPAYGVPGQESAPASSEPSQFYSFQESKAAGGEYGGRGGRGLSDGEFQGGYGGEFGQGQQEGKEIYSFSMGFGWQKTERGGDGLTAEQRERRVNASSLFHTDGESKRPPIIYPDKDYWESLSKNRRKYANVDLDGPVDRLAMLRGELKQLDDIESRKRGRGLDKSGDKYERIYENPFVEAEGERAVSTFSIDVDTASYANMRQFLMQSGQLPPAGAVRIEELVNYFDYDYTAPTGDTPFAAHVEVAGCPWQAEHRLVRVGIKGREIETDKRPQSNLVFLIDVSGSMNEPAKLPLLVEGMKMLTKELGENDRVAIVVYASSEGLALPSTRGDKQDVILAALEKLRAGGSTAGGAGIELAYKIAKENFVEGGVNRVILATDGDFNVGTTSTDALEAMAEKNAKETGVFLTVLGFGRGNLNDSMMERISGVGNGNYHYVDNRTEARKVMVAEMAGTLVTIAKDVKIQIEFNPAQVAAYRLIGYENRMLKTQDFNDDKKDAGEIGAGHTVTAIYEVVPAGKAVGIPGVDPLKYQPKNAKPQSDADSSKELLTLKLRYKQPDGDVSTKVEFPITDNGQAFAKATDDFKFASAVASFGMLLRNSEHRGNTSYSAVAEIAEDGTGEDKHGYRAEFLQLVERAKHLAGE